MDDIKNAARAAHIHHLITGLPHGYETVVAEGGASLSGGERQRLGIARAFLKNAPILILDEPTSALDMSVQAQITRLLRDLQQKHNLAYMFISHDLRVVRVMAHEVIVMKDGKVIESGPAEQVIKSPKTSYTKALMAAAFDLEADQTGAVST